jgi:hypothetical protein
MTVSDSGGVCECPTCDAVFGGRFEGCASVIERPGYAPVHTPRGAVERTLPGKVVPQPSSSARDTDSADDDALDLIALRDQTRWGDVPARHELATRVMRRSEIAALNDALADIRSDLARATAQHSHAIDHVMKAIDQLALQREADRATLRSVVKGIDRLARRVSRLDPA